MEKNLFDLPPEEPAEAPDVTESPEVPLYSLPDRACLVCGERKWQWSPEKRAYACGGN